MEQRGKLDVDNAKEGSLLPSEGEVSTSLFRIRSLKGKGSSYRKAASLERREKLN